MDFSPKGPTINAEAYSNTLKKLNIQSRRREMLTGRVSLLHENTRPHTERVSHELLTSFGWHIVTRPPPYSPNLTPLDYHFSLK